MSGRLPTPVHSSPEETTARLQEIVREFTGGDSAPKALEAGCGEYPSPLGLSPATFIVGMDVSEHQLARNSWATEKVVGDIQTHDFPRDAFDVVVCWDVLEHLPRPERALENFAYTVKPGGLVVIKVPNLMSGKGLITKLSPHRFHIWVYEHLLGYENPGTEDRPPFRTFFKRAIAPAALLRFAKTNGFSVELFRTWEARRQMRLRERFRLRGPAWVLVRFAVKVLSLGRIDLEATELLAVFRKPRDE